METTRGTESPRESVSVEQQTQSSRRDTKETSITKRWKIAACILGVVAILLSAGLATSLGIFLIKKECRPPPRVTNATTTYLGSALPGTTVTYFCHSPFLFPDNSPSFTLACTDSLEWEPKVIPSCGIYVKRTCIILDFSLTVVSRPVNGTLEMELTIQGSVPESLLVNIPMFDDSICTYEGLEQIFSTLLPETWTLPEHLLPIVNDGEVAVVGVAVVVKVVFENVDPWAPYEVRLRSVGRKLSVSVVQEEHTATVFTTWPALNATLTTTTPTSTASETTTISPTSETTNTTTSETTITNTATSTSTPTTTSTHSTDKTHV